MTVLGCALKVGLLYGTNYSVTGLVFECTKNWELVNCFQGRHLATDGGGTSVQSPRTEVF